MKPVTKSTFVQSCISSLLCINRECVKTTRITVQRNRAFIGAMLLLPLSTSEREYSNTRVVDARHEKENTSSHLLGLIFGRLVNRVTPPGVRPLPLVPTVRLTT